MNILQIKPEGERAELHAAVLQYVVARVLQIEGDTHNAETEHPVDGDGALAYVALQSLDVVAIQGILRQHAAVDIEVHHGAETNPEVLVELMGIAQVGRTGERPCNEEYLY